MNRTKNESKIGKQSLASLLIQNQPPAVGEPSQAYRRYALATAIAISSVTLAAGCRSGGGMNLFAGKGPSAEALAGTGPTTTYPVPPSSSATPQAIASIAGGTAKPPSATSPPTVNYAAAAANGMTGRTVGYRSTPPTNAGSPNLGGPNSGVQTASNSTPSYQSPNFAMPASATSTKTDATATNANSPAIQPPSGYALSPAASNNSATPYAAKPTVTTKPAPAKSAGKPAGMALPSSLTAAMPTSNLSEPGGPSATASPSPTANGFVFPGDSLPPGSSSAASIAASPPASSMTMPSNVGPSAQSASLPATATDSIAPVGYTPGSIRAVTDGYPGATSTVPKSSGSFYR